MGARISAFLALNHPACGRSVMFGGVGVNMVHGVPGSTAIAEALEASDPGSVTDRQAQLFRKFAETTKSDLLALAACIRSSRVKITRDALSGLVPPALVAVGTKDDVAGSGPALAAILPRGEALDITGRDHMLAVGDKVYEAGALDFLARLDGGHAGA